MGFSNDRSRGGAARNSLRQIENRMDKELSEQLCRIYLDKLAQPAGVIVGGKEDWGVDHMHKSVRVGTVS